MKYDRNRTNHFQIFAARQYFYYTVKKAKSISEAEFNRWLWANWGVKYKGWGDHMILEFDTPKHETLFRLRFS